MNKKIALSALVVFLGLNTTFTYGAPVSLERNIAQINSSIAKANYRGADEVVYKTLSEYKNNLEVQALAAVSWALQSKLELAQDQIDRLKTVIPKNSDLHFAQGVVFYKRTTSSNMEYRSKAESLMDIAAREFRYAIQLNPNNYKAYNALGVMDLRSGDYDKARRNIERALELAPNYAVAIDNLGTVYLAEGDTSKAEYCFKKAISVNPNSSAAYYHLAQLEYASGNYAKCLTYINKCLAWRGCSSYAYNLRGDAYKQQGNEAAAIAAYKKAIEISPENLAPYANLAGIYETRKDYELALDSYKTILTINPNAEPILLKVADLYLDMGKYNESVAYYERVSAALKPEALKGLASAYYALAMDLASKSHLVSDKKLIEASDYLEKAIKQSPNDLELYLAKAKLSALLNSPKDSCESLNNILSSPCVGIDDYLIKGEANITLANFKEGFDNYREAIKYANSVNEKLYLGELFMFSKLYDEAETVFNDLLRCDPANVLAKNNLSYIKLLRIAATQQVDNANYFRKRNNTFFEREYLNKALKIYPYDIRANMLMGRLNQRQRKYNEAVVNYSLVVAKTKDVDTLTNYSRRLNKVKSKVTRKCEREQARAAREQARALGAQTREDNIVPVNNVKPEKVKKEKVKAPKQEKVKPEKVKAPKKEKVEKVKTPKPEKVKPEPKPKTEKVKPEPKPKTEKVKAPKPEKVKTPKPKVGKVKPEPNKVKKVKKVKNKHKNYAPKVDYSMKEM